VSTDLDSLFLLVPAAEEEDLLKLVDVERWRSEIESECQDARRLDDWFDDPSPTRPRPVDAAPPADPDVLRELQVLGLVQHRLGAEVVAVTRHR
jgi:hypothetical protein